MKIKITAAALVVVGMLPNRAWADADLDIDDLPDVVRTSVERVVKAGVIEEIEWEADAKVPHYEVEYSIDGVEWELHVAEDGRVLRHEQD